MVFVDDGPSEEDGTIRERLWQDGEHRNSVGRHRKAAPGSLLFSEQDPEYFSFVVNTLNKW